MSDRATPSRYACSASSSRPPRSSNTTTENPASRRARATVRRSSRSLRISLDRNTVRVAAQRAKASGSSRRTADAVSTRIGTPSMMAGRAAWPELHPEVWGQPGLKRPAVLGAIHDACQLNVTYLQEVCRDSRATEWRTASAICEVSREFWQVAGSAWQNSSRLRNASDGTTGSHQKRAESRDGDGRPAGTCVGMTTATGAPSCRGALSVRWGSIIRAARMPAASRRRSRLRRLGLAATPRRPGAGLTVDRCGPSMRSSPGRKG
jgi:hypothetical protein